MTNFRRRVKLFVRGHSNPPLAQPSIVQSTEPARKPILNYQALYDAVARKDQSDHVIGEGDFDAGGRLELQELIHNGLLPQHALIDFGCGIGRLALHAIPYLASGKYTGIDISPTMIGRAIQKCQSISNGCAVNWRVQADERFDLPHESYDMLCAYSVFTHMEHEDTWRYLKSALPILKPGGKFLFSALLIDTTPGARYFLISADRTLVERWSSPRIVVTSRDLMTEICKLAGWPIVNWYQPPAGQAICVLQKPV